MTVIEGSRRRTDLSLMPRLGYEEPNDRGQYTNIDQASSTLTIHRDKGAWLWTWWYACPEYAKELVAGAENRCPKTAAWPECIFQVLPPIDVVVSGPFPSLRQYCYTPSATLKHRIHQSG
jgi:hypothetical protein